MTPPRDCVPALEAILSEAAPELFLREWAVSLPVRHGWRGRTCRDLWDTAPKGTWLLRWAERSGAPHHSLVRAAAACVRPVLRFVPAGEDRPRLAVEAAERWADEPTEENRGRAKDAAGDAWAAAHGPRWLATWAAGAVASATGDRRRVETAAYDAVGAHIHAEGEGSQAAAHLACADAVRRLVPFIDLHAAGGGQ